MTFDVEWVRARAPGHNIVWLDSTSSTMAEASRLAAAGCPSGSVVGAEEQTAGEGRHGRRWHSAREAGLYASIVLRLGLAADALPVMTLALGLATAEAITSLADLTCDLRWPNDVLVDGKKCAGILTRLEDGAVIAGLGVNVNHERLPEEIASAATSLRMASGKAVRRERLLLRLLASIDTHLELLAARGNAPILDLFTQGSSYARGRRVVAHLGQKTLVGVTDGLTPQGYLALSTADGGRSIIVAGGVRPA